MGRSEQQAYWKPGADLSMPFFLRRMDTEGRIRVPQIPETELPMYGFMFLRSGQVLLSVGGEPLLLHGGEFLLIPPGTPFAIRYYHDSVGYTGGFRENFLKDASHPVLRDGHFAVQAFTHKDMVFVDDIFRHLQEVFPRDTAYLKSGIDFLLAQLSPDEHREGSGIAAKFIDMVFDRNDRVGTVAYYARRLNISADLLNHHVRRYSNHSAMEWVNISRLAHARNLLMDTDLPIQDIAEATGLDDPSYFSRFFKKQEGLTPSQFRKNNSKKS